MENFNLKFDDLSYALIHQANKLMINKIINKLSIQMEKVPINIDRFGNTSCTTIPLLIVTELNHISYINTTKCLLSGFGVGLSWGNCFVDLQDLKVSELVEV
jgi:3-oxoacyl-[acyl-carrier-protein] synthase-3